MPDPVPSPRAYFDRLLGRTDRADAQAVVNLAFVQLQVEELRESSPSWAAAIDRPRGAAGVGPLRALLEAAAGLGIVPEDGSVEEMAGLLAEGGFLAWPPGP